MPPHNLYGNTRGVRWDPKEQEWLLKCDDCSRKAEKCFWPLNLEFWNPKSMQRCRACNLVLKRIKAKESRSKREVRERNRLAAKAYYIENRRVMNMKHAIYMRETRAKEREGK